MNENELQPWTKLDEAKSKSSKLKNGLIFKIQIFTLTSYINVESDQVLLPKV